MGLIGIDLWSFNAKVMVILGITENHQLQYWNMDGKKSMGFFIIFWELLILDGFSLRVYFKYVSSASSNLRCEILNHGK
jgi:hypothetical protein